MGDRPIEDRVCGKLDQIIFEHVTDSLQDYRSQYAIDGIHPELLFSRHPDTYPLYVDLGDERLAIEIDVSVWKITKGGPSDGSCSENEAFAIKDRS